MAVYARWFFVARLIITVFLTSIPIADLVRANDGIDFEGKHLPSLAIEVRSSSMASRSNTHSANFPNS